MPTSVVSKTQEPPQPSSTPLDTGVGPTITGVYPTTKLPATADHYTIAKCLHLLYTFWLCIEVSSNNSACIITYIFPFSCHSTSAPCSVVTGIYIKRKTFQMKNVFMFDIYTSHHRACIIPDSRTCSS